MIDSNLLKLASWKLARNINKSAFVPPQAAGGMDPAIMGGSMPPMDPAAMMGGGGMPPMDPAMGGMPPIDPAMLGMPPMGPPPADPAAGGAPPADPAAAGAGGPKKPKLDPSAIYIEQVRNRKLLLGIYRQLGLKLPEDILDDENIVAPGVVPPSVGKETPTEEPKSPGLPGVGGSPAINPIEPAQGAGPSITELLGQPGGMPG
jgi:hypothetical protein